MGSGAVIIAADEFDAASYVSSAEQSSGKHNSKVGVFNIVLITALVVLLVAALVTCFFVKRRRGSSRSGKRGKRHEETTTKNNNNNGNNGNDDLGILEVEKGDGETSSNQTQN